MNEPNRLRELCDDGLERALLDAGVAYRSSDLARAKTLAALGVAGSAAVSIGAVTVGSSSLLSKVGWTKLLAISGLGVAAVVPAGYYALQHANSAQAPLVATVVPAAPKAEQRASGPALPPSTEATEAILAAELPQVDAPNALPAPRTDSRAVAQSALAAELAALDAVRSRLGSGDASGALSLLDDYSRTFPRGRLALEAEVLRIDALAKNGQTGAAAKRAEGFLRRHPNSVLASRVRGYLRE